MGQADADTELADMPIGQRTRARNPLGEVTIEELEAMLREDEILNSEGEDDEAYHQFLQVMQMLRPSCLIARKSNALPVEVTPCPGRSPFPFTR